KHGRACFSVKGQDNRGIILQNIPIEPEPYQLSGWVRCQGLGEAQALLNVEWIGKGNAYLGGIAIGSVTGDAEWTWISREVVPPEDAVLARVECLTNTNNSGTAWFDDIRLVTAASGDTFPPSPVRFRARPSRWVTGAIRLDWEAYSEPSDLVLYRIYLSSEPIGNLAGMTPTAEVRAGTKVAVIPGAQVGIPCYVTVVPVDRYGNVPTDFETGMVIPVNAGAPRVELIPLVGATGAIAVRIDPPLGSDEPLGYSVSVECAGSQRTLNLLGPRATAVINGLPPSSEAVIRVACGKGVGEGPVAVARTKTLPLAAAPARAKADLSGRITDADGVPISGAQVALVMQQAPRCVAISGADGSFEITAPANRTPQAARLFALADGYLCSYENVLVGAGKVNLTLKLQPAVSRAWHIWTVPPLAQVFRDEDRPVNASSSIHLLAARNETECYQLVIRSFEELDNVRIVFEDLQQIDGKAVIGADNFTARFINYVHVEVNSRATPPKELVRFAPAEFPDELSDDATRTVEAGVTQPIFLSFYVPPRTPPGIYAGNVYLQTPRGMDPVPVTLEVLPLDFPVNTRLWVVNWFSTNNFETHYGLAPYSEGWWGMLREYARMFRRYHQNVVTVSPALCKIWVEEDNSYTYDWSHFDKWCELFLAEGIRRLNITHLGGRTTGEWECPEFTLHDRPATKRGSGESTTVPVEAFLSALQDHLEAKGWLDIAYQHVADEPIPINVESWKAQSNRVHRAAPKLKRMDAIQVPDLRGFCELWVPQLNYFDQWYENYDRWHRAGEFELWFYVAWVPQGKYPNRLIDTATSKPRIIHWMNYLYNATGYLHWGFNHWHIKFANFSPGDEWMVWPGCDGPNSSLRYEAQREGLEDCEYLFMLEDAERKVIEKLGATGFDAHDRPHEIGRRVVRSITDYTHSYDELQAAREEVLRDILAAQIPPLAIVRTNPRSSKPIRPSEINVWGVTELGCEVLVNGQPATFDGNRFLARVSITAEAPEVKIEIRKGRNRKTITRRFAVDASE
ncbi:MAG: glycoside hydrolase domain-containing protein, partial [Candidatus Zipacnadales bacterium]